MKNVFKYFIAVLFICIVYMGFAQTKIDTVYIKYSGAKRNTTKDSASYYRVRTISDGVLRAEDYSMKDSVLKCSGYYTNFDPYIKQGFFVYYSTNLDGGFILGRSEGNYLNDQEDGVWKYYYPSGELFYTQEYVKGAKTGLLQVYYKTGEIKRKEEYKNDKRIKQQCYTKSGKDTVCYDMYSMPIFTGGEQAKVQYCQNKLRYPEGAREIQGTVYVWYVVNTDGSISDVEIVKGRGVHPLLDEEAIRCVKSMPTWTPGYIDGTPVKVKMIQRIRFTLP